MKKVTTLVLALLLACVALQAQTTKGTWSLGLHNFSPNITQAPGLLSPTNALGISVGKYKSENITGDTETSYATVGLSGNVHYFLIDNLSLGLQLSYLHQSLTLGSVSISDNRLTSNLFMAGPELRYYLPMGSRLKVFLNGSAAIGSAKTSVFGESDPAKLTRFSGGGGLAIFPNEHFSLDIGVGYGSFSSKQNYEMSNGQTSENNESNSGLALDIGFSVFF